MLHAKVSLDYFTTVHIVMYAWMGLMNGAMDLIISCSVTCYANSTLKQKKNHTIFDWYNVNNIIVTI